MLLPLPSQIALPVVCVFSDASVTPSSENIAVHPGMALGCSAQVQPRLENGSTFLKLLLDPVVSWRALTAFQRGAIEFVLSCSYEEPVSLTIILVRVGGVSCLDCWEFVHDILACWHCFLGGGRFTGGFGGVLTATTAHCLQFQTTHTEQGWTCVGVDVGVGIDGENPPVQLCIICRSCPCTINSICCAGHCWRTQTNHGKMIPSDLK